MEKRVAFLSGTAWYLWNFRRNVIAALVEDGWSVAVIAGADEWSPKLAEIAGVEIFDWGLSLDGHHPVEEMRALFQAARLLRRTKPRIVFNNGIKANIYGGLASRLLNLTYVNNISGLGMRVRRRDAMGRILARLYGFASSGAKALLIQNEADHEFLIRNGLSRAAPTIRTMGSGVDLDHFVDTPPPPDHPRRFLFIGRLQEDKGIADFVKAAHRVQAAGLAARFTVVGDTRHANTGAVSAATLSEWRKRENIEFVGRQSDVRPFLAAAHVLVMPSHGGEGLPKVILEAAASGRPAIVSDVAGCRDGVIDGQTGWIAPPGNPETLAKVMEEVCEMPLVDLTKMSHRARDFANRAFSDRIVADLCLQLANDNA